MLLFLIGLTCIFNVFAHSGRTDSNGGHWDRSTGTYHYHSGTNDDDIITEYDEGYNDGYSDGYNEGETDWLENGYNQGYSEGYSDGYAEKHEESLDTYTKLEKLQQDYEEKSSQFYTLLILVILYLGYKFVRYIKHEK